MDSKNEIIIVDDSIATTNGINGNCEEVIERKTRSKGTDDEMPAKSKLRSSRTASAQREEKEKMNLRSGDTSAKSSDTITEEAIVSSNKKDTDIKTSPKDTANVRIVPVVWQDAKNAGGSKKGKPVDGGVYDEKTTSSTPTKKKSTDREDDSGINSRASSVSIEDSYGPRMRTRSSKIPSTSTPTSKKIPGRMPLSSYDFDDLAFDDDVTSSNSLKRKAVLYVEEMDDETETNDESVGEPAVKRPAFAERTIGIFGKLLYPFMAVYGRMTVKIPAEKVEHVETEAVTDDEDASPTDTTKEIDDGNEATDENDEATVQTTEIIVKSGEKTYPSGCRVM